MIISFKLPGTKITTVADVHNAYQQDSRAVSDHVHELFSYKSPLKNNIQQNPHNKYLWKCNANCPYMDSCDARKPDVLADNDIMHRSLRRQSGQGNVRHLKSPQSLTVSDLSRHNQLVVVDNEIRNRASVCDSLDATFNTSRDSDILMSECNLNTSFESKESIRTDADEPDFDTLMATLNSTIDSDTTLQCKDAFTSTKDLNYSAEFEHFKTKCESLEPPRWKSQQSGRAMLDVTFTITQERGQAAKVEYGNHNQQVNTPRNNIKTHKEFGSPTKHRPNICRSNTVSQMKYSTRQEKENTQMWPVHSADQFRPRANSLSTTRFGVKAITKPLGHTINYEQTYVNHNSGVTHLKPISKVNLFKPRPKSENTLSMSSTCSGDNQRVGQKNELFNKIKMVNGELFRNINDSEQITIEHLGYF